MEEGLVIQHFYDSNTEVICQCRCDQCAILGPQKALAGQGDAIFCQSDYRLVLDKDACIQCGACIERCPRGVEPAKLVEAVRLLVIRQQGQNHLKPDAIPALLDEDLPQQAIVTALRKYSK